MTAPGLSSPLQRFQEGLLPVREAGEEAWLQDLGASPSCVVRPTDRAQLIETLRITRLLQKSLVAVGGGTGLGSCRPLETDAVVVETGELDGVVEYSRDDFVVAVEAGMSLAKLQTMLAENQQWLPVEPPDAPRATLGGAVAAAATSNLAASLGTLRNHLLGVVVAHADGRISRAGGRVVKNVSGYDLMKLYHGSHGTLAVIVELILRVQPLPELDLLVWGKTPGRDLRDLRSELFSAGIQPAAVHIYSKDGMTARGSSIVVRLQGAARAVEEQLRGVESACPNLNTLEAKTGEVQDLPEPLGDLQAIASRRLEQPAAPVVISVHYRPSRIDGVRAGLESFAADVKAASVQGGFSLDLGRGLLQARFTGASEKHASDWAGAIRALRAGLPAGARAVIQCAPPWLRRAVSPFEVSESERKLYRRLCDTLDPDAMLIPGRLFDAATS